MMTKKRSLLASQIDSLIPTQPETALSPQLGVGSQMLSVHALSAPSKGSDKQFCA
jgi:hypothetical protein